MQRLVFSRLFDRLPGIRILAHHLGAMIPYFEGRIVYGLDQLGARTADEDYGALLEEPLRGSATSACCAGRPVEPLYSLFSVRLSCSASPCEPAISVPSEHHAEVLGIMTGPALAGP